METSRSIAGILRNYIKDSTIENIAEEISTRESITINAAKESIYDFQCGNLKRKIYFSGPHIFKNLKRLALIYKIIGFQNNHNIVSLTEEVNPAFREIFQNLENPTNLSSTIIKDEDSLINYISHIYSVRESDKIKKTTPKEILNLISKNLPRNLATKIFDNHRRLFYQDIENQPFCKNKTKKFIDFLTNNSQIQFYLNNLNQQETN